MTKRRRISKRTTKKLHNAVIIDYISRWDFQFVSPPDLSYMLVMQAEVFAQIVKAWGMPPVPKPRSLTEPYGPLSEPLSDEMRAWLEDKRHDRTRISKRTTRKLHNAAVIGSFAHVWTLFGAPPAPRRIVGYDLAIKKDLFSVLVTYFGAARSRKVWLQEQITALKADLITTEWPGMVQAAIQEYECALQRMNGYDAPNTDQ